MPYFKWSGINLQGEIVKGKSYARSAQSLDALLFTLEIALLRCTLIRQYWKRPFSYELLGLFFRQLAVLLGGGVRLYDALIMAQLVVRDTPLSSLIQDCALQVHEGTPLSKSLEGYSEHMRTFVVQTIAIGEESGKLGHAMKRLADTLDEYQLFNKRLKSALIMPLITLFFFLILFGVIFYSVIPRFKILLQAHQESLPFITRIIFAVSDTLHSSMFIGVTLGVLLGGIVVLGVLSYIGKFKQLNDRLVLAVPGIQHLIKEYSRIQFLQSLGLLLENGVPLVKALTMSTGMVSNSILKESYAALAISVNKGLSFSEAWTLQKAIYTPEIEAFIKVGMASGTLPAMIFHAVQFYKEQLYQQLSFCITLIQPAMLIVMGILIALLIIALYMPLFTVSAIM